MIAHGDRLARPPFIDGTSVLNRICQPDMDIGGRDIRSSPHPLTHNVSEGAESHRMYRSSRTTHAQIETEAFAFTSVQWIKHGSYTTRSPTRTMDTHAPTLESKKNAGTFRHKKLIKSGN